MSFLKLLFYLKDSPYSNSLPEMPTIAGAVPGDNWELRTASGSPQKPRALDHRVLPSWIHLQEAGSEVELAGVLTDTPKWDIGL